MNAPLTTSPATAGSQQSPNNRMMDPKSDTTPWLIGRSRLIVVPAVLLAAFSLFLLGAALVFSKIYINREGHELRMRREQDERAKDGEPK